MYYVWPYDVFLQSSIIPIEQRLVGCLNQLNANKNCYLSQLFPPILSDIAVMIPILISSYQLTHFRGITFKNTSSQKKKQQNHLMLFSIRIGFSFFNTS